MQIESTELPLRLAEQQSGTANYNSVSLTVALGMVRFFSQQSVQEWLRRGLRTAATRLNCNKDGVNLRQLFGIVKSRDPTAIRRKLPLIVCEQYLKQLLFRRKLCETIFR